MPWIYWICSFCCTTLCAINPLVSYYSLRNGTHSSLKTWSKLSAGTKNLALRLDWKKIYQTLVHVFSEKTQTCDTYWFCVCTSGYLHTMMHCSCLNGKLLPDLTHITHGIILAFPYEHSIISLIKLPECKKPLSPSITLNPSPKMIIKRGMRQKSWN